MKKLHIAVVMGGVSSEREISLRSGAKVAEALDRDRYDVSTLDFQGDPAQIVALRGQVDAIFLALHGPGGEDGRIQGLLDLLHIPYTGSGVLGSAAAMHKSLAKVIYRGHGIPCPAGITVKVGAEALDCAAKRALAEVGLPCVVKPAQEGSTIGITVAREESDLTRGMETAAQYDRELLVESFIAGVEISVPVLGLRPLRALPAVEIVPKSGFYDYEMKYTKGMTEEICPARISDVAARRAASCALRAHEALYCRGVSRTDMIVQGDEVTVLETNTLPGMTETSLLPLSAATAGISFPALLDMLIDDALAAGA